MSPRVAFPFYVLPENAVATGETWLGVKGQPLDTIGPIFPNWDYACDLEVRTSLSIDWVLAAKALDLPSDTLCLKTSLLCGTGSGSLPRRWNRICERTLNRDCNQTELNGILRGSTLSGRLLIRVQISLEGPLGEGSTLSPKQRGSRLWQESRDVLIEDGGDARFPVETASFSRIFQGGLQQHAPWSLFWQSDSWQTDFAACVRLYINADRPDILERFQHGDAVLLQAIMGSVMAQMIGVAISRDDIHEQLEICDEGSVGRQVQEWMAMAFPQLGLRGVRSLYNQDPGRFYAALLAAAEIGGMDP